MRDHECTVAVPIDLSHGCVGTTRLDRTTLNDRPTHSFLETSCETTERVSGGGRAAACSLERFREHVLIEEEIRYQLLQSTVPVLQVM